MFCRRVCSRTSWAIDPCAGKLRTGEELAVRWECGALVVLTSLSKGLRVQILVMHRRFVRDDLALGIEAIPAVAMWTSEGAGIARQWADGRLAEEASHHAVWFEDLGHVPASRGGRTGRRRRRRRRRRSCRSSGGVAPRTRAMLLPLSHARRVPKRPCMTRLSFDAQQPTWTRLRLPCPPLQARL